MDDILPTALLVVPDEPERMCTRVCGWCGRRRGIREEREGKERTKKVGGGHSPDAAADGRLRRGVVLGVRAVDRRPLAVVAAYIYRGWERR